MFVAPAPRLARHQLGCQLAVRGGDGEQFEARHPLGGAGLVGVDVRARRRHDGAPARQQAGERDDVGARAVEHGERLGTLAEVRADHLRNLGGVAVFAVGDLMTAVGGGERSQHLGVHTCVVVAREGAPVGIVQRGYRHTSILHPMTMWGLGGLPMYGGQHGEPGRARYPVTIDAAGVDRAAGDRLARRMAGRKTGRTSLRGGRRARPMNGGACTTTTAM